MNYQILTGDVQEQMATLPAQSVHCAVTSPPYWGLRDYGTANWVGGDASCDHKPPNDAPRGNRGHPTEHAGRHAGDCKKCCARRVDKQIGLEPTPQEYVAKMVAVFGELWRVLRDDGTLWLNLGDSYASGNSGSGYQRLDALGEKHRGGGHKHSERPVGRCPTTPGLKTKDLCGVPWLVALGLRGAGWYLRSAITLCKSSPMPESVRDRPTQATEMLFLLTKQAAYYYDQHPSGRNLWNYWPWVPEAGYPDAHFATFPTWLPRKCIRLGTSQHGVCGQCGSPWRRLVERKQLKRSRPNEHVKRSGEQGTGNSCGNTVAGVQATTKGWEPGCDCNAEVVPATVLDPFAGSGTTLQVALEQGRRAIGIELNPEYVKLIRKRVASGSLVKDDAAEQTLPLFPAA